MFYLSYQHQGEIFTHNRLISRKKYRVIINRGIFTKVEKWGEGHQDNGVITEGTNIDKNKQGTKKK